MNPALIHILCFGNLWHGDDGFGLHVLRRLRDERRLPPHVRTLDAGTAGLNAIPLFEGCTKAVLVDAVKTGAKIGQLHRLSVNGCVPAVEQQGMHGSGVESLLSALPVAFANRTMPELVLIGAEIGPITPFTAVLSPALAGAMTQAVKLVMLECTSPAR
ncbi:hydrogenase maturation protease [Mycobacterium sp.]|uniref:hydrogenase maturation protease n=1 Tax=Mycobacterium sp. TaxID=1785 RepID=UPI002D69D318|nr:hydrogenase maturation protease [Mycobacterium sp.]HZA08912.1 hydrogenase maturation protease [Mycobacterium sp.]